MTLGTARELTLIMQVRGALARVDNAAHVDMAEAAPESLQMGRQQNDFPGRLDATQLEGCWLNPCCCQGYRPTGPDSYVTSCNLVWGFLVCPDQGEVYTRVGGTNIFRGPTITLEAAHSNREQINGAHHFKSKSIATFSSIFAASSGSPLKGCECMCCYGVHPCVPDP